MRRGCPKAEAGPRGRHVTGATNFLCSEMFQEKVKWSTLGHQLYVSVCHSPPITVIARALKSNGRFVVHQNPEVNDLSTFIMDGFLSTSDPKGALIKWKY